MNSKAVVAIILVYFGCMLNNVFLEYMIRVDPGSGHLITFSQFIFIAIHGFIKTSKFGKAPRVIPLRHYITLVVLFFITSVFNNWAFSFNIPVPLHMIFRSGSLLANMVLGILVLKKKYTLPKFLSVAMITIGIIICTLISGSEKAKGCSDCDLDVNTTVVENKEFSLWLIGILILSSALFLSARMGIYQESLYARFGKHPQEALYYTHLLSLPGFLLYAPSIIEHGNIVANSETYNFPITGTPFPLLFVYLVGNVLTQYICISSVYVLTTECSSLTVTLVITLRKFFSLLLSIVYFQNPFTLGHWIGTALVFTGTLLFTEVFSKMNMLRRPDTVKKRS